MAQEFGHMQVVNPDAYNILSGNHSYYKKQQHGGYAEFGPHFCCQYGHNHQCGYKQNEIAR